MSKSTNSDFGYDMDEFTALFKKACGNRTQMQFAQDSGMSGAFVSRYMKQHYAKPPIPSTLKKIAAVAANGVTFEDLMKCAGYDLNKYNHMGNFQELYYANIYEPFAQSSMKRIKGILDKKQIKYFESAVNSESNSLNISLKNKRPYRWYFRFLPVKDVELNGKDLARDELIYSGYGRIAAHSPFEMAKYSFVTDSEYIYYGLMNKPASQLTACVTVILVNNNFMVEDEQLVSAYNEHEFEELYLV